jgi:hypothetical protein
MEILQCKRFLNPSYSLDLIIADFCLLGKIKEKPRIMQAYSEEEFVDAVINIVRNIGVHKMATLHWNVTFSKSLISYRCANVLFPCKQNARKNHENFLITMRNQNHSKVLRIIRPKCPGSPIRPTQKVTIRQSMNRLLTGRLANTFQRQNAQIFSDSNCPMARPGRAKVPSV